MKKGLLILLCLPMIGFGQNKFEIGIITGFSTDYSNHPLNNMIPVDKKSDYGIVFGAGASYSIDKLNILVDFHFNQGISDFSSEEWKDFLQNYEEKDNNMSLSTMFGITYNI